MWRPRPRMMWRSDLPLDADMAREARQAGMDQYERELRRAIEEVWDLLHENGKEDEEAPGLAYGCVREYRDGTSLWYEPVSDTADGFVLRRGRPVECRYSEARGLFILDPDDPDVIAVFERKENG